MSVRVLGLSIVHAIKIFSEHFVNDCLIKFVYRIMDSSLSPRCVCVCVCLCVCVVFVCLFVGWFG